MLYRGLIQMTMAVISYYILISENGLFFYLKKATSTFFLLFQRTYMTLISLQYVNYRVIKT